MVNRITKTRIGALVGIVQASLDPLLRIALETKSGFVAIDQKVAQAAKKSS